MPRYAYQCPFCRTEVEEWVKVMDLQTTTFPCPNPACPYDGDLVRQPSIPSLAFKGSGWTPKYYNK